MNIEEIKKWRHTKITKFQSMVPFLDDEDYGYLDWLIDHVEKFKWNDEDIIQARTENIETTEEVALRCAEIASTAKYLSNKVWTTDHVAEAIRKEFKLET